MNDEQFDPRHDAAIRTVLRETVEQSGAARRPRRGLIAAALTLAGLLALGGGGYAVAAAHPEFFGLGGSTSPEQSASAQPRVEQTPSGAPVTATPVPVPVAPASPTPTAAPTVATPVIASPIAGQRFTSPASITISGTGTPGTHVFITEYCTLAPPACTEPAELGQPGQPQIVVGADGRWSTVTPIEPPQTLSFRITASAAFVDASGAAEPGGSGQSTPVTFTVVSTG